MIEKIDINKDTLPKHVAIIMDGNGRWAKKQSKLRVFGHKVGVNAGHDLNLQNLAYFVSSVPFLDEVSIGHALISDALYMGLEKTIKAYKNCCK